MVVVYPFSLLGIGIYRRSFRCHSAMVVALTDAPVKSIEWAASIEHNEAKEDVLREINNNGVLKARLRRL